ncbi:alpha-ketoacid dehydrogenase kinase [Ceratobasidium sp. AG-Ba]|nr:alpha-ketoacid dehydrogenase kinase [Ceratobasidium sp. AG-Ba]QRW05708.1 alpha-ketoacid dehydrogenase kinase [Ceratobasidium sp. AG-Ba]
MSAGFRISSQLWDKIHHFAAFPQTGVSLQQMAMFGRNPSQGTLLKASQFLSEELPVRLAHRIRELDELPHKLRDMPSIKKVKYWYAQSFQELIEFPAPRLDKRTRDILNQPPPENTHLPEATANPVMPKLLRAIGSSRLASMQTNGNGNGNGGKMRIPMQRLYCSAQSSEVWPPEVYEYNKNFTRALEAIKRRHDPTVTTVAQGVLEWKRSQGMVQLDNDIQAWLDRFYMSRIGIRFLIGQHVALNTQESHPDYVGIICTRCNVHDVAHEAIENARFVCEEHYALFKGPPVQLICPPDLHFPYVPGHLSHILFELLKNSLRAVVERYGPESERNLPPIKVIVVEGHEDITIKISDEGGGIPRSSVPLVWGYLFTTMEGQNLDQDFHASDFKAPMAGFGYGLPLSRLYARYFGGDLRLISMEGYGTDVYIHLNRLSSSREALL